MGILFLPICAQSFTNNHRCQRLLQVDDGHVKQIPMEQKATAKNPATTVLAIRPTRSLVVAEQAGNQQTNGQR